jgi:ABC-type transporter Mla subunit MlaD
MRKILIIAAVCVLLLFLLSVYATPPTSPTWTVRLHASHGLMTGDAVEEAGHRIGQVIAVEPRIDAAGNPGTEVLITLNPGARDRLRERSTLLVTTPAGSARPVLNLVVFDEKSPALPPGSRMAGVESEMELEFKRQILALDGTVRDLTQQLDQVRRTLDGISKSEEKRKLEESVGGFLDTVRRSRDDLLRIVTEEIARWRKIYEKLFPPEREKTVYTPHGHS